MTKQEHLLTIAAEECVEVAQRLTKALRFGMEEVQPGQTLTNRERIYAEYYDLRAVLGMCGIDAWDDSLQAKNAEQEKVQKVEHFLAYAEQCGTVTPDAAAVVARLREDLKHFHGGAVDAACRVVTELLGVNHA